VASADRARRDRIPALALTALLATWSIVLYRFAELRHDRFGTFGFDLGIYDQAGWLVAFNEPAFMTVRGLEVWGHHGTFVFYLLAPGYWLGGGAKWLLAAQVAAQASGGLALYLLVRDLLGRRFRWLGVGAAALLLLHPTSQWLVWEFFHPDSLAIGPLLLAWWAARTQRWVLFGVFALVAASCKEDVVLSIAMIGVIIAASRPRTRDTLRIGVATALVSAGWYLLVTRWMIPAHNPFGAFYEQQFFSDFGQSTGQVVWNVVSDPLHTLWYIKSPDHLEWYRMMFLPVLLSCFLRPKVMLIAAPMIAVVLLTDEGHSFVRVSWYHYSAIPVAVTVLAVVECVVWVGTRVEGRTDWRRWSPHALLAVMVVMGLVATRLWGVFPGSERAAIGAGFWPRWPGESALDVVVGVDARRDPRAAAKADAVEMVPAGARVSAAYNVTPHLAHRRFVYQYPNPWLAENWGVQDENQHDPGSIDWLLVDRQLLERGSPAAQVVDHLLANEFDVVFEREDVVLARRSGPPACIADPAGVVRGDANADFYVTSAPPSTGMVCPVT